MSWSVCTMLSSADIREYVLSYINQLNELVVYYVTINSEEEQVDEKEKGKKDEESKSE